MCWLLKEWSTKRRSYSNSTDRSEKDARIISRADERLRDMYGGPSDAKAVERMRVRASAKAKYTALTSAYDDVLIESNTGLRGINTCGGSSLKGKS